jgi:hypothetical protein
MNTKEALELWWDDTRRTEIRKVLRSNGLDDVVKRLDASASSARAFEEIALLEDAPTEKKKKKKTK